MTTFYVRQEWWPHQVVGSVRCRDISVALDVARREHGRGIYVSSSNAPPVNTVRYLEAHELERRQATA